MNAKEVVELLRDNIESLDIGIEIQPYWEMDDLSRPLTSNIGFMIYDKDGKGHQVIMPGAYR